MRASLVVNYQSALIAAALRFETGRNELGLDHNETRFPAFAGAGLARLAPARFAPHAGLRDAGRYPSQGQHRHAPKKQPDDDPPSATADPLVGAGNPPCRHAPGTTPHQTRCRHHTLPSSHAAVITWSLWR